MRDCPFHAVGEPIDIGPLSALDDDLLAKPPVIDLDFHSRPYDGPNKFAAKFILPMIDCDRCGKTIQPRSANQLCCPECRRVKDRVRARVRRVEVLESGRSPSGPGCRAFGVEPPRAVSPASPLPSLSQAARDA